MRAETAVCDVMASSRVEYNDDDDDDSDEEQMIGVHYIVRPISLHNCPGISTN